jgi:hypothetical protein
MDYVFLGQPPFLYCTTTHLYSRMSIDNKALVPPPPGSDTLSSPGPFEGPEKLLEVWFAPSPEALSSSSSSSSGKRREGEYRGLRMVPRAVWEEMLDIVKCKVLSVVEGDEVDAYLLRYVFFLWRWCWRQIQYVPPNTRGIPRSSREDPKEERYKDGHIHGEAES